jgi:hypothetical protein
MQIWKPQKEKGGLEYLGLDETISEGILHTTTRQALESSCLGYWRVAGSCKHDTELFFMRCIPVVATIQSKHVYVEYTVKHNSVYIVLLKTV